ARVDLVGGGQDDVTKTGRPQQWPELPPDVDVAPIVDLEVAVGANRRVKRRARRPDEVPAPVRAAQRDETALPEHASNLSKSRTGRPYMLEQGMAESQIEGVVREWQLVDGC